MTNEEITVELTEHEQKIKSLGYRMDKAEKVNAEIHNIVTAIEKLTINMSHMLEEQKRQGTRLERLEQAPKEGMDKFKAALISGIVSLFVGGVGGALLNLVIK